jgi:adenylyl-sulfate kinase
MRKGFTVWFTGLPCSGKTTVANIVHSKLKQRGLKAEMLDGDEVRKSLSKGLGFSKEDRDTHIRRVGWVCEILTRNDVVAVASFISPYREIREELRKKIKRFVEVYVKCPIDICESRDTKGLFKKAKDGEIAQFTGISDPYEEPLQPDVVLETDKFTPEHCATMVLEKLESMGYIQPSKDTPPYTKEEEEQIRKRLEDLGYI